MRRSQSDLSAWAIRAGSNVARGASTRTTRRQRGSSVSIVRTSPSRPSAARIDREAEEARAVARSGGEVVCGGASRHAGEHGADGSAVFLSGGGRIRRFRRMRRVALVLVVSLLLGLAGTAPVRADLEDVPYTVVRGDTGHRIARRFGL